jgi:hypothetical protein
MRPKLMEYQKLDKLCEQPLISPSPLRISSADMKLTSTQSENSEGNVAITVKNEGKINGNAYKRRNVYKAIVRRMFSYIQKENDKVVALLTENGFSKEEIDSAFFYIRHLNDLDKQKGKSKRLQNTINGILEVKTVYTYILKETLWLMLRGWETGERGKIMSDNVSIYKEVCENYFNRCIQLLAQPD